MTRCREMIDVQCQILADSGEAILIYINNSQHWIPLSQVDRITRLNGVTTVRLAAWIARAKRII